MSLKTSGAMHYHGLDGVHLGIEGDEIILYYGESKMHGDYKSGVKNAINDLTEFNESLDAEEFEIDLISNNIDISKFGEHAEDIKRIIDPYSSDKEKVKNVFSIFIGFNWSSVGEIDFPNIQKDIKKSLEGELGKKADDIFNTCHQQVQENSFTALLEFFFIPFKDVEQMRKWFLEAIG